MALRLNLHEIELSSTQPDIHHPVQPDHPNLLSKRLHMLPVSHQSSANQIHIFVTIDLIVKNLIKILEPQPFGVGVNLLKKILMELFLGDVELRVVLHRVIMSHNIHVFIEISALFSSPSANLLRVRDQSPAERAVEMLFDVCVDF